MARKGTIETSLYNKWRRKIQFKNGAKVWLDPKGNKHTRIQIKMLLSNESMQNTPEFVSAAFSTMEKAESAEDYTGFDRYMLGMAVNIFVSAAKSSRPTIRLTGCELDKFYLSKEGSGEGAEVYLHFQLDVTGNKELYDYMWDHHNNIGYIECDYDENTIQFPGPDSEDEEEEENE